MNLLLLLLPPPISSCFITFDLTLTSLPALAYLSLLPTVLVPSAVIHTLSSIPRSSSFYSTYCTYLKSHALVVIRLAIPVDLSSYHTSPRFPPHRSPAYLRPTVGVLRTLFLVPQLSTPTPTLPTYSP